MSLDAGDAIKGTGLAGAIAGARKEAYGKMYSVKDDARGINLEAAAIIDYLVNNTEVAVQELPGGTTVTPPGVGTIS